MINKAFRWIARLMVVWVILAVIVGYMDPKLLLVLRPHTDWLFSLTMLGIGMVMSGKDFAPIFKKPHTTLLGTMAQFAIMPLLGFLIAKALRLPPELALGLIIVGAAPGAMASNVISYLAKTDVAYSVALTTTTTFLAPILTPTFTYIFARSYISIPFWPMFISIINMVIIPLMIGILIRKYYAETVVKYEEIFPALSAIFIAFICGLVVALNRPIIANVSLIVFFAVFLHNMLGLILGYYAGVLYRFDVKRCRTLAFEVGMQNAGLGAVLCLKYFSPEAALPNAIFATWCIVTASLLAEYWAHHSK
jgi:bile acid:Na+ symporter, BASS family